MYIADRMLSEYAQNGTFSNIDVIDYLGPTILMSERLTFLGIVFLKKIYLIVYKH